MCIQTVLRLIKLKLNINENRQTCLSPQRDISRRELSATLNDHVSANCNFACDLTLKQDCSDKVFSDDREEKTRFFFEKPSDSMNKLALRNTYSNVKLGADNLSSSLLRRPNDRTPDEIEIIYEDLLHVRALSHLSYMVKRELASVLFFESHEKAGTVCKHTFHLQFHRKCIIVCSCR